MAASRRGMILILSSPSGAGKTTLTRMLMQDSALDLTLSVSVTTRTRRSSEVDGVHYHFIDRGEFERMRAADELLESGEVDVNAYATRRAPVVFLMTRGPPRPPLFPCPTLCQFSGPLAAGVVSVFGLR